MYTLYLFSVLLLFVDAQFDLPSTFTLASALALYNKSATTALGICEGVSYQCPAGFGGVSGSPVQPEACSFSTRPYTWDVQNVFTNSSQDTSIYSTVPRSYPYPLCGYPSFANGEALKFDPTGFNIPPFLFGNTTWGFVIDPAGGIYQPRFYFDPTTNNGFIQGQVTNLQPLNTQTTLFGIIPARQINFLFYLSFKRTNRTSTPLPFSCVTPAPSVTKFEMVSGALMSHAGRWAGAYLVFMPYNNNTRTPLTFNNKTSVLYLGRGQSGKSEFLGFSQQIRVRQVFGSNFISSVLLALLNGRNSLILNFNALVSCPCVCSGTNSTTPPLAFQKSVATVNDQRLALTGKKLDWEFNLRQVATSLANKCTSLKTKQDRIDDLYYINQLAPITRAGNDLAARAQAYAGNLAVNRGGYTSLAKAQDASKDWMGEQKYFNCTLNQCKPGRSCGHFLVAAAAKPSTTGCAIATCTTGSPFPFVKTWYHHVCVYDTRFGTTKARPYACNV